MYKKLIDGLHAAFGQKYGGLNNTRQSAETWNWLYDGGFEIHIYLEYLVVPDYQ